MTSPRLLLLPWVAVFLSLPACLTVPDLDAAKAEVRIVAPGETAYTNGVLDVELEVTGDSPDRVELLLDDTVLATVEPPYTYPWDTVEVAEGTHRLVGRVLLGGETFTSPARDVVVDRTPPQVVSRTPEPGTQDVRVRSPIQAVFSEPVKAATLTDASVRLTLGSVDIARTVTLSTDGKTLTVTPGPEYVASNPASLGLTSQVTDLAGNSVDAPSGTWTWLVPYWVPWGTASGAPSATRFERMGSYQFDSSGSVVAVWLAGTGSSTELYVKRWENNEWRSLGIAVAVASGGLAIHSESLILDELDNPVIAWSQGVDPNTIRVQVKRWVHDHWEPLGTPLSTSTALPEQRGMALQWTPSRQLSAAWTESSEARTRLCASQWTSQTWQPIGDCFDVSTKIFTDIFLSLLFTPSGMPLLTWRDPYDTLSFHTSQFQEGQWQSLANDQPTNIQGAYASIQLDHTGNPWIAWSAFDGTAYSLNIEHYIDYDWLHVGTALNASPGNTTVWDHALAFDDTGAPVVAWMEEDPAGAQVHVRRWDGQTWQSLDDSSSSERYVTARPFMLQRNGSGGLVLSWLSGSGSADERLQVRTLNR